MTATAVRTQDIPALGREGAMRLAATEYEHFADLLDALGADDWSKPTDCDRWDVRGIVSHLVGMQDAMISMREMLRQQRASKLIAKQEGLGSFDGWTEYQSRASADVSTDELIAAYRKRVPALLAVRARTSPLRALRFPFPPYGWMSMGYLRDEILTRDVWMHRVDISRATGRPLVLTADHDARFVASIVRDLARRWDRPFTLELSGPAGGTYVKGGGAEAVRVDAVEFCRVLSGRSEGHGLPTQVVPF